MKRKGLFIGMSLVAAFALTGIVLGVKFIDKPIDEKYISGAVVKLGDKLRDKELNDHNTYTTKDGEMIVEFDFAKMNHAVLEENMDNEHVSFYRIKDDFVWNLTKYGNPYWISFSDVSIGNVGNPEDYEIASDLIKAAGYKTSDMLGWQCAYKPNGWVYISRSDFVELNDYEHLDLGGYYYYTKPVAPGEMPTDIITNYCFVSPLGDDWVYQAAQWSPVYEKVETMATSTDVYEDGDYLEVWNNLEK